MGHFFEMDQKWAKSIFQKRDFWPKMAKNDQKSPKSGTFFTCFGSKKIFFLKIFFFFGKIFFSLEKFIFGLGGRKNRKFRKKIEKSSKNRKTQKWKEKSNRAIFKELWDFLILGPKNGHFRPNF